MAHYVLATYVDFLQRKAAINFQWVVLALINQ